MALLVVLLSIALVVALVVLVIVLGRGGGGAPEPAPGDTPGAGGGDTADDGAEDGGDGAADDPDSGAADASALYEAELVEIDLDGGLTYVDLDTEPPTVSDTKIGGHDLSLGTTTGTPGLHSQDSVQMTLAPLPEGGAEPDAASCRDAVETNGTYTSDFEQDARFCLQTDEGAVAAIQVTASPHGRGPAAFEVTLWE